MAENKNVRKNSPVKKKRKLNAKGRTVVRRSVGGVLLASALIIASLPSDKSGTASAALPEDMNVFQAVNMLNGVRDEGGFYKRDDADRIGNTGLDYDGDLIDAPSNASKYDLSGYDPANARWSLFVNSGGQLQELYGYYTTLLSGIPSEVGIIGGLSDMITVSDLQINNMVCDCYDYYTESQYSAYMNKYTEKAYTLEDPTKSKVYITADDDTKTGEPALTANDGEMPLDKLELLFKDQVTKDLAEYKSIHDDFLAEYGYEPSYDEMVLAGWKRYHIYYGRNIKSDDSYKFFCSEHRGRMSNEYLSDNYTLEKVSTALVSNLVDPDNLTGPKFSNKDVKNIYIVKYEGTDKDFNQMDERGLLYANAQNVVGIGDNAFGGNDSIKTLVLGTGVKYVGKNAFNNCSKLSSVTLNDVSSIDSRVFYGCTKLQTVNMAGEIQAIGNEAFYNCAALRQITIPDQVKNIGFGAFAKCSTLGSVVISSNVECTISDYAFYDDPALSSVDFSNMSLGVGLGKACFALSDKLNSDMMTVFTFPSVIQKDRTYQLYGANVDLFRDTAQAKGAGTGADIPNAVTLNNSSVSALKTPCEYTSYVGDYIFANRSKLESVYLDALGTSKERLPMNTFLGCKKLKEVRIKDDENLLEFDANIFREVEEEKLCVYGPRSSTTNTGETEEGVGYYAQPRMSTWATYSAASEYVPYRYGDHYEVGGSASDKPFIFDLAIKEQPVPPQMGTASLQNCTFLGNLGTTELGTEDDPFTIPASVADLKVVDLEPGCLNRIKDNIKYFAVPDDSLASLGDNALEGCKILEGVTIGDSVRTIGNECFKACPELKKITIGSGISSVGNDAFYNCKKLEDVYWDEPDDGMTDAASWANQGRSIGSGAFNTGADNDTGKLYFHGYAGSVNYEPFKYAMDPRNTINGKSVHICYMESTPDDMSDAYLWPDLTDDERKSRIQTMSMVYGDNGKGDQGVYLIDYPRLEELPASLKNAVQNGTFNNLSQAEQTLVNATRYVNIPPVVDYIDVKGFIGDGKKVDVRYIDNTDKSRSLYGVTKRQLYGGSDIAIDTSARFSLYAPAPEVTRPGLFSGDVADNVTAIHNWPSPKPVTGDESFSEESSRGNDWVLTVDLRRVKKLPDYCFDSCERLLLVNLGEALGATSDTIGEKVFHGCSRLEQLAADYTYENPYLAVEDMVLYRHDMGQNDQELVACLAPRKDILSPASDHDSRYLRSVTSIKDGAFDGCTKLAKVDLSEVPGLSVINKDCFAGCKKLSSVVLSENITQIGDGAFKGCNNTFEVKIPNMMTDVSVDAFDDYDPVEDTYITIKTPEKSVAFYRTYESGKGPQHIHWDPISNITVTFWKSREDWINGGDIFDEAQRDLCVQKYDKAPANIQFPSTSAVSDFLEWECVVDGQTLTGNQVGNNITKDRDIYATYKLPDPVYHTVVFLNDDWSYIDTPQTIPDGGKVSIPATHKLTTKLPERAGEEDKYEFAGWKCKKNQQDVALDLIYNYENNITDDWECMATFKLKGPPNTPTPTIDPNASVTPTVNPTSPTPTQKPGTTATPTPKPGTTPTATPTGVSDNTIYNGKMYYAIVENGSGSGQYPAGSVITVTAYAAPEGRTFDRWTTSNTDIGISNILAVSTTFIMPSHDVKVTATYKSKAVSGNELTPTYGPTPTLPPNVTATPTPIGRKGDTDVIITTDTIDNNKKNLGNATVAGSTDNFIVKVTDSAAATAAVEAALRNAYGTRFTDLRYSAFDISLYDSTGTYLVSNANSLAVTITLPIPEALLSYAGNNKAGAVINGQLQELAVSYTTIDGVPCMRFTATHFSPYTIYVDTGNIVRGITDNTPKTGDGIKPKWFLSGGMLSMSAVLFLWKEKNPIVAEDKRRRRKKPSGR